MSDKLSDFGYNFQIKIIASLFTDRAYLKQINDLLEPNMFESEANYFIVDTIKKYFKVSYNLKTLWSDSPQLYIMISGVKKWAKEYC